MGSLWTLLASRKKNDKNDFPGHFGGAGVAAGNRGFPCSVYCSNALTVSR